MDDGGGWALDTTLYWSASCTYASGTSSSGDCAAAYRDASLTTASGYTTPCSWHYGLTSSNCSSVAEMSTSHSGDHVYVGDYDSFVHACDGRTSEDPDLDLWVR